MSMLIVRKSCFSFIIYPIGLDVLILGLNIIYAHTLHGSDDWVCYVLHSMHRLFLNVTHIICL